MRLATLPAGYAESTPGSPNANLVKQLLLTGAALPYVEFRFHPTRRWRFDLAWPLRLLAVEVEGGIWTRGRHTRGVGVERDMEKYNEAVLAGWRVLRVSPAMVDDGRALALIERALSS